MAFLEWSDDFLTGIHDIDNDHWALFEFVNTLADRIDEEAAQETVASVIAGLVNYVNVHFAREEMYMEEAGYPGLDQHRISHERLRDRVMDLAGEYEHDPIAFDCAELLEFLRDWLTGHILVSDMDYVPHLRPPGDAA